MNKELEAIKYLNDTCIKFLDRTKELYCTVTFTRKRAEILRDDIAEVNKALHRLEAIDNANPSEALECLEWLSKEIPQYDSWIKYITTIKQALLKAQEQEKEKLFFKNIHNTKVKTPLVSIFEGLSKDERFKFTEHIYYHWEEMKEALEEQNKQLTEENIELKKKLNKHYLKWEDLEFKETHKIKILMNGNLYNLLCYDEKYIEIRTIKGEYMLTLDNDNSEDKQFFNDLHLERVEE